MSRLIATTLVVGCTFAAAAQAHEVAGSSSTVIKGGVRTAVAYQSRDVFRPTASDRVVRPILVRIRADADALRRLTVPGGVSGNPSSNDNVSYLIDDVVAATDHLTDHFDRRQVVQTDVEDLMRRAAGVQTAIGGRRSTTQLRNGWTRLQTDLNSLASAYGMTWDWQNPSYSSNDSTGIYQRLNGTYQLDPARSDDPQRIADQAMRQATGAARTRISRRIQNRLDPPQQIAIERVNNQVSLASSVAPRVTFDANGQANTETIGGARNATSRATLYGDRLEIVTTGNADTDFTAIFEPLDSGQSLRVTKRLESSTVGQPIVVRSVYRRTSETPQWNIYNGRQAAVGTSGRNAPYDRNTQNGRNSQYDDVIADGTMLTATLEQPLNIRTVQQNDVVSLTVRNAPTAALEGAVIEGYVTSTPSSMNNAGLSLAFNQIRLRNGRTAGFAGTVETVRGPNGETISFNGEDAASDNQRDTAIQRGAIGAAVGAVIGAIAGGAKGAAIGAVVGGGGGAATVLIGGQRTTDLPRGTEFTIRSRGFSQ